MDLFVVLAFVCFLAALIFSWRAWAMVLLCAGLMFWLLADAGPVTIG